jgi:transposase-like protein
MWDQPYGHQFNPRRAVKGESHTISQVCKQISTMDQTCYRWRKAHGGMKIDQAKQLKELEAENARLKPGMNLRCVRARCRSADRSSTCLCNTGYAGRHRMID